MIDHNKVLKVAEDIVKYYINTIKEGISFLEAFIGLSLAFKRMENSIKTSGLLSEEQIEAIKKSLDTLLKKEVKNEEK